MPADARDRLLALSEIDAALAKLSNWSVDLDRNALHRHIELEDFAAAFGLMTRIAILAEKADHHPEWSNVYNRLDIWLTTHDVGGISGRDIALATAVDMCLASSGHGDRR